MSASREFSKLFKLSSLLEIYAKYIKDSTATGIDNCRAIVYEKDAKRDISAALERINSDCYRFSQYKEKLISKGANKPPRVLSIPTIRDRVILKALSKFLAKLYPQAITEIPQVKINRVVEAVKSGGYGAFIKIDLKNFYPSIPHEQLLKILKEKIRKKQILALIENAIRMPTVSKGGVNASINDKGVPQGLSISNLLAEIYISDVDQHFYEDPSLHYTRYVDDILILCRIEDSEAIYERAISYLNSKLLEPHKRDFIGSKTQVEPISKGFEYLGYSFKAGRISPKESSIKNFESKIASVLTAYKYKNEISKNDADRIKALDVCQWRLNLKLSGCIFQSKRLGWVFYFSQADNTTCFRHIDSTVASMLSRAGIKGKIKVKKVLKAYYEARRTDKSTHKYVVNFDTMSTVEKKEILQSYLGANKVGKLSDAKIDSLFKMKLRDIIKELEQDTSQDSSSL